MSETSYPLSFSRRAVVGATASRTALPRSLPEGRAGTRPATVVNDIHSRLNPTRVDAVVQPSSVHHLRRAVHAAAANDAGISFAGGRHAMGGQQFRTGSVLIDMSGLHRVLSFDRNAGVVEVEGGIQWPQLVAWLAREQQGEQEAWGIVQKQTGADRLSIGGALSANVHGRGLVHRPIIQDVESLVLMGPDGTERLCSREQNIELFTLAIGGYGLLGPIVSVRLRLAHRHKVERIVEVLDVDDVAAAFERRIAAGFEFGDFQYATDENEESFMRRGVFSCYRPVSDDVPVSAAPVEMSEADWMRLGYLAHTDRKQAFDTYAGFYLSTSGQVYWSDTHQMSYYRDDYHVALSQQLGERHPSSEMITEVYAKVTFRGRASPGPASSSTCTSTTPRPGSNGCGAPSWGSSTPRSTVVAAIT